MLDSESTTMAVDGVQLNEGPLPTSPEASSTASDSPTPTNSVHEKNWASHWHMLICEEQRQLLGTEEESSDRHSSDEGGDVVGAWEEEIWQINDEQRRYYTEQFRALQPDTGALLPGPIARQFLEKSRLSVLELRNIWQLADITKDGALSLSEFNIAMHLVVLRRHNIALPERLPASLAPSTTDVTLSEVRRDNTTTDTSLPAATEGSAHPHSPGLINWTKFLDSPTNSVSSPGPKPVNFDFQKSDVKQDPMILHPVPVRLTQTPETLEEGTQKHVEVTSMGDSNAIRPVQRPQPKKPTAPGPGAIPPPPHILPEESLFGPMSLPISSAAPKKEPPPPPPPRPHRTHIRSSSLDLNRLGKVVGFINYNNPPIVPPRTSPRTTSPKKEVSHTGSDAVESTAQSAEFSQLSESDERGHGAFQIYRKAVNDNLDGSLSKDSLPLDVSMDSRLQHSITGMRCLCLELQHTLVSLKEERACLESLLEELNQDKY